MLDVLKIDVEATEWPFLRNLVEVEPEQSDHIRQLLLEIHTPFERPRRLDGIHLVEMIHYVRGLARLGFALVRNRRANWCCGAFSGLMPKSVPEKCCHETFYVNTRFLNETGRSS